MASTMRNGLIRPMFLVLLGLFALAACGVTGPPVAGGEQMNSHGSP